MIILIVSFLYEDYRSKIFSREQILDGSFVSDGIIDSYSSLVSSFQTINISKELKMEAGSSSI